MGKLNKKDFLLHQMINIEERFPFVKDWFFGYGFMYLPNQTFEQALVTQQEGFYENIASTKEDFESSFYEYVNDMIEFLGIEDEKITAISIYPGTDKNKEAEEFSVISLKVGSVTAVVGMTGSGKSRLLADIEWGAKQDTPTGRTVKFNGKTSSENKNFRTKKIVAQLSQNMNFVLDMNVESFLRMHKECFSSDKDDFIIKRVYETAIKLSGEPFSMDTHITNLSGGQSRALMIADCAMLSNAPIVLIDEIENAGIDRKQAVKLLTGEDKIVLIATHDPVLALLADTRLVIKNGGIKHVLLRSDEEMQVLQEVEEMDLKMMELRSKLRRGERLT